MFFRKNITSLFVLALSLIVAGCAGQQPSPRAAATSNVSGTVVNASDKAIAERLVQYCADARNGDKDAMYNVGEIYSRPYVGTRKGLRERFFNKENNASVDLAAAMFWLDTAIYYGRKDASALRKTLGKMASKDEFRVYSVFSRLELGAPCELEQVSDISAHMAQPQIELRATQQELNFINKAPNDNVSEDMYE